MGDTGTECARSGDPAQSAPSSKFDIDPEAICGREFRILQSRDSDWRNHAAVGAERKGCEVRRFRSNRDLNLHQMSDPTFKGGRPNTIRAEWSCRQAVAVMDTDCFSEKSNGYEDTKADSAQTRQQ